MTHPTQCARCGGPMSEGFIVDNTYGGREVSSWVEGEPTKSFWAGLSFHGHQPIEIKTWRCDRCGFLESYAGA